MADYAASMHFQDSNGVWHNGVMNRPYSKGADWQVQADGINNVVRPVYGRNYYYLTRVTGQTNMVNDIEFDIGGDGRPVIYIAETDYLAGWTAKGISHYVEGYGYTDNGAAQTIKYADSMWSSLQGTPGGDHSITASQMWSAVNYNSTDLIIF